VRRGARPPQQALPKVLRIGIIQGGKIIEERIVRRRETVTFGPNEKNTFVLPASDIPVSRYELFETRGGPYTLSFTDAMQGRVSIGGEVHELSDLKTSGKARKKGKLFQLQLNDAARGKIVIGESTVLFQFVAPPPIQPRPQLPAAVRGGLLRNVDWFITTLWIISFLFHSGVIVWWETTDWPVVSAWDKYMQLEELITPEQATWEKTKPQAEEGEGEAEDEEAEDGEEEQEEQKKGPSKKDDTPKKSAAEIARERAEKRAALAAAIAEQGINKILGTLGGDSQGAIADVLRGGDVGADQDDLLSQVSGVGVATSETAGSLKGPAGGKGSGEAADIDQIKVKGGDATVKTAGPGSERKIKGKVKKKKPVASGGTGLMSASDVAKVVNRRLGAIKGCYEQALKRNPTLAGKVTIRFTISGSGKVTTARAVLNELTPAVGNCMVAAFKRFRFPPPEGGTVTFEYPFMFTPAG
jgi:TonB family protein